MVTSPLFSNAEFGPDLQNNLHPFAIAGHRFASQFAFTNIACNLMDAALGAKGSTACL